MLGKMRKENQDIHRGYISSQIPSWMRICSLEMERSSWEFFLNLINRINMTPFVIIRCEANPIYVLEGDPIAPCDLHLNKPHERNLSSPRQK